MQKDAVKNDKPATQQIQPGRKPLEGNSRRKTGYSTPDARVGITDSSSQNADLQSHSERVLTQHCVLLGTIRNVSVSRYSGPRKVVTFQLNAENVLENQPTMPYSDAIGIPAQQHLQFKPVNSRIVYTSHGKSRPFAPSPVCGLVTLWIQQLHSKETLPRTCAHTVKNFCKMSEPAINSDALMLRSQRNC